MQQRIEAKYDEWMKVRMGRFRAWLFLFLMASAYAIATLRHESWAWILWFPMVVGLAGCALTQYACHIVSQELEALIEAKRKADGCPPGT